MKEASRVQSIVTPDSQMLQGFGGTSGHFDPSFRTKGSESPVQRHRKKVSKNKKLKHRSANEVQQFYEGIVRELLGLQEVVRKHGSMWVLYDDQSGVQIGAFKTRKAAWDAQRIKRLQKRRSKKKDTKKSHFKTIGKPSQKKATKAQVPQTSKTPKVNKVKGIKAIKPISPLKPIRPKGLKASKASNEAFERLVAMGLIREQETK